MLRNKRVLITGCTAGIGHEVAKGFAKQNYDLILIGRNEVKLQSLSAELRSLADKQIKIDYFVCDFEKLSQVAQVSKLITSAYREIDVLVNNAGVWEQKRREDDHGWEMTWVVNYFASFILTNNVLPILELTAAETHDVRIINMASEAHRFGKIQFPLAKTFHFFKTYGSTKLANVLHASYLANKFADQNIRVNSVHPGVVASNFWNKFPTFISSALKKFMITPEEGARTALSLAISPEVTVTGHYFENMKSVKPSKDALDATTMIALYNETRILLKEYLVN